MTNADSPIVQAEQRSWNYWFIDGLPSLVAGIACLLAAFGLYTTSIRPENPVTIVLAIAALILYGVVVLRMREIIEWLKERITYPRTGYTAPPPARWREDTALSQDLTVLSLQGADTKKLSEIERLNANRKQRTWVLMVLALVAPSVTMEIESRWICLVVGVLAGLGLWLGMRKYERGSWIEVAAFPLIGLYLVIFPVARENRLGRLYDFLAGGGLALMLSGTLRLVQYLRRNPASSA